MIPPTRHRPQAANSSPLSFALAHSHNCLSSATTVALVSHTSCCLHPATRRLQSESSTRPVLDSLRHLDCCPALRYYNGRPCVSNAVTGENCLSKWLCVQVSTCSLLPFLPFPLFHLLSQHILHSRLCFHLLLVLLCLLLLSHYSVSVVVRHNILLSVPASCSSVSARLSLREPRSDQRSVPPLLTRR